MSEEDLAQRITNLENDMMLVRDGTLGWETNVKARLYLGTNQNNLVNNTHTKVLLDTKNYDPSGIVDLTNNRINILQSGYYSFDASIRFIGIGTDKQIILEVYLNGVIMDYPRRVCTISSGFTLNYADTIHFNKDDDIELYARHKNGDDTPDIEAGKGYTFMSVHLLSKD